MDGLKRPGSASRVALAASELGLRRCGLYQQERPLAMTVRSTAMCPAIRFETRPCSKGCGRRYRKPRILVSRRRAKDGGEGGPPTRSARYARRFGALTRVGVF